MSFIELLRKTRTEVCGDADPRSNERIPWVELLRRTKAEGLARSADPWRLRLERVRGKTDYNGVERISTQDLFDILEVPQRARSAGACRRLAALMRKLGWTPMKARGLGQSGYREQVRGYARDQRNLARSPGGPSPSHHRTVTRLRNSSRLIEIWLLYMSAHGCDGFMVLCERRNTNSGRYRSLTFPATGNGA